MAIKTISQFNAAFPTDNDYILFEQNGEGKSAKFSDFSLSYEEIMASTDLSGKVASASALKHLRPVGIRKFHNNYPSTSYVEQTDCRITIPANCIFGISVSRGYSYSIPEVLIITYLPPDSQEFDKNPLAKDVNDGTFYSVSANAVGLTDGDPRDVYVYAKDSANTTSGKNTSLLRAWYIQL